MKFTQATKFLLLVGTCEAFAPAQRFAVSHGGTRSAHPMAVDPHFFNDLPTHVQSLHDTFSTLSLSDAMDVVTDPGAAAATAIDEVAKDNNGWFGFLTGPTELLLQAIHSLLVNAGLSADAWGITIIVMTLVIKIATFPLTKTQLESTNKMQVSFGVINIGFCSC